MLGRLRERWRAGKPPFLIRVGSAIAFVGNGVWLALALQEPIERWAGTVAPAAAGLILSAIPPILLSQRPARGPKHFAIHSLLASAIVVLTPPGLVGGGVALAGAAWGMLATYDVDERGADA